VAVIIWHMLTGDEAFDVSRMVDGKLARKAETMSRSALLAGQGGAEPANGEPALQGFGVASPQEQKVATRKAGVTGQKRKKAG
jgi:hypothetical protein